MTDPGIDDLLAARPVVAAHLPSTPLLEEPGLSELLGAEVFVKYENLLPTHAFKVRGGVYLASTLGDDDEARARGLFTASTGNHGQSIAWAGRRFGIPVTVAAPDGANPSKVAAMRRFGAEVKLHGRDFDEAREWIGEQAHACGARFVGPTDRELICGVGSYALEIFDALPDAEFLFVPIGAGSAACGCCLAAAHAGNRCHVIGVQAEGAPAQFRSWQAGLPVTASMETRAEGVATRVPFANTHAILKDPQVGLADFVLVGDDEMEDAIRILLAEARTVAEHAGAAALAAARKLRERIAGTRVVLVLSGGNLDPSSLRRIVAAG